MKIERAAFKFGAQSQNLNCQSAVLVRVFRTFSNEPYQIGEL